MRTGALIYSHFRYILGLEISPFICKHRGFIYSHLCTFTHWGFLNSHLPHTRWLHTCLFTFTHWGFIIVILLYSTKWKQFWQNNILLSVLTARLKQEGQMSFSQNAQSINQSINKITGSRQTSDQWRETRRWPLPHHMNYCYMHLALSYEGDSLTFLSMISEYSLNTVAGSFLDCFN